MNRKSCFPKKKVHTLPLYGFIKYKEVLINKNKKMRNKTLFEQKLERFESEVKKIGYHIHRNEQEESYEKVAELLEKVADMRTLLNTEDQD